MNERKIGLIIFGIILLAIGLFASFYQVTRNVAVGDVIDGKETITPLRNVGIVLIIAGIIFLALGFLYLSRKTVRPREL
jgi:uncharacterized membrane protein YidH (DUF202 family)